MKTSYERKKNQLSTHGLSHSARIERILGEIFVLFSIIRHVTGACCAEEEKNVKQNICFNYLLNCRISVTRFIALYQTIRIQSKDCGIQLIINKDISHHDVIMYVKQTNPIIFYIIKSYLQF